MIIRDREQFETFLSKLWKQEVAVVDTETTGLDAWGKDRLCGIGFAFHNGESFYLPFRHVKHDPDIPLFALMEQEEESDNLPIEWLQEIWPVMHRLKVMIGHNIKYDMAIMKHDGYEMPVGPDMPQLLEDTMSGARMWFHDKYDSLSLENLVTSLLGKDIAQWKADFTKYLAQRGIKNHYDRAEVEVLGDYCEKDTINTFECRKALIKHVQETDQVEVYETEREVVTVLWDMENQGLPLDLAYIDHAIKECNSACAILLKAIFDICGIEINPWSAPQVTQAFAMLGQHPLAFTEKENSPSWTDDVLAKLMNKKTKSPIVNLAKAIFNWRKIDKMLNTFFLPYSANSEGVVHPFFKPWGTITGRLSCEDPNLQQLSKPEEWDIPQIPDFNIQVRRMIAPPEGYYLLCVDYAQMEMIGFADYLNDPVLTAELNKGIVDYHTMVKDMIFAKTGIELIRKDAKPISLGLIYGMGKEKFARRLERKIEEAQELKDAFFAAFPTARPFIDQVHSVAKLRGYVFNKFKRRYYIDAERVYAAVNYLVQGSCADIIKRAMVRLFKFFLSNKMKSRLASQMHDEFLFLIKKEEWHQAVPGIIQIMEDVTVSKTRFFVDVSVGNPSWDDKLKVCKSCLAIKPKGEEETHQCLTNAIAA